MEVLIAAAKTHKYSVSESGDSLEATERPQGGVSVVLVDGQGSGKAARLNSCMIAARCVAMISDGARDGAVARAAHDVLFASRGGKVSAELLIVSADLASSTLLVSRNSACPVLVQQGDQVHLLAGESTPIGVHGHTKPQIDAFPLLPDTLVLGFSDGIWLAGRYLGQQWGVAEIEQLVRAHTGQPRQVVDAVLASAMNRDQGRPRDDMTVMAVAVSKRPAGDKIRSMEMRLPF